MRTLECPWTKGLNINEDGLIRDYCVSNGYRFTLMPERVSFHDPLTLSELQQKKRAWECGRSYVLFSGIGGTRMASKFALAKLKRIIDFTREKGFSFCLAPFQIELVVIMICGMMEILRHPLARDL